MIKFLLIYLTVYSLVHYYLLHKTAMLLDLGTKARWGLVFFMLLMILAPILIRVAENMGHKAGMEQFAYLSFTWMGLLFLFIIIFAVLDTARFGLFLVDKIGWMKVSLPPLNPKAVFTGIAVLVLGIYGYGLYEARAIRTEHVTIRSPELSEETGRIRLAQISDVHLGLIVRTARLEKILTAVEEARPDVFFVTGDLVDGQLDDIGAMAAMFSRIAPPYGKFAITGNHEFYAGLDSSLDFIRHAGFTTLRNRSVRVGGINIVGVDDGAAERFQVQRQPLEPELLANLPPDGFTILLKHRPVIDAQSAGLFDLQLSGHTHKGQIFPFNILTYIFYPRPSGLSVLDTGARLYLSRGTGTWGPPIRFLSPPEVTIIDLVPEMN